MEEGQLKAGKKSMWNRALTW